MASGRIGGTKSKVSGVIGNTVYQVRRNPDGTYSQIVMVKGVQTVNYTTPRLQAQRMCTAMVESLMKQLRPVATISMQSAANKSKSLNAFASYNLMLVAQDSKANWYQGNRFVYPEHLSTSLQIQDLGGVYMISSGTLSRNTFDDVIYERNPFYYYFGITGQGVQLYGLKFNCQIGRTRLRDFLNQHGMTYLDKVVFCGFRRWYVMNEKTEEEEEKLKHSYIIASINPSMPIDTVLSIQTIPYLFKIESDVQATVCISRDYTNFVIGYLAQADILTEDLYYIAAFSISWQDGKKKISSSSYARPDGSTLPYWDNRAPAQVFGSWMGQPEVVPYPSPF